MWNEKRIEIAWKKESKEWKKGEKKGSILEVTSALQLKPYLTAHNQSANPVSQEMQPIDITTRSTLSPKSGEHKINLSVKSMYWLP